MYGGSTVAAMGYPPGMAGGLEQLQPGAFGQPRLNPQALQGVNLATGGAPAGGSPGGMGAAPPMGPQGGMMQMGNVPPELMAAIQAMQQQAQQRFAPPAAQVGQPVVPEDSMNIGHMDLGGLAPMGPRVLSDAMMRDVPSYGPRASRQALLRSRGLRGGGAY